MDITAGMGAASIETEGQGRLFLSGVLDSGTVPSLWNECVVLLAGQKSVDMDLSKVEHSDSAGLVLLLACQREVQRLGGEIRFSKMPAQMHEIVRVSGLDEILPQ